MAFIPVADRLCAGSLNECFHPSRELRLAEFCTLLITASDCTTRRVCKHIYDSRRNTAATRKQLAKVKTFKYCQFLIILREINYIFIIHYDFFSASGNACRNS